MKISEIDAREPHTRKFRDISGQVFENCTVIKFVGFCRKYSTYLAKCRCGNEFLARQNSLANKPVSCGSCRRLERKYAKEYDVWRNRRGDMVDQFANNFAWFVECLGRRPKGMFLSKRNRAKRHSPENSYWGSENYYPAGIEFEGEMLTLQQWGDRLGLTRERVRQRIEKYGVRAALTTPAGESAVSKHRCASTSFDNKTYEMLRIMSVVEDTSVGGAMKLLVKEGLARRKETLDAAKSAIEGARLAVKS